MDRKAGFAEKAAYGGRFPMPVSPGACLPLVFCLSTWKTLSEKVT